MNGLCASLLYCSSHLSKFSKDITIYNASVSILGCLSSRKCATHVGRKEMSAQKSFLGFSLVVDIWNKKQNEGVRLGWPEATEPCSKEDAALHSCSPRSLGSAGTRQYKTWPFAQLLLGPVMLVSHRNDKLLEILLHWRYCAISVEGGGMEIGYCTAVSTGFIEQRR